MAASVADSVLGIVAGGGQFPVLVAQGARENGYSVVAVGFSGHTDPDFSSHTDHFSELKVGQLGKLISFFKKHGVTKVVMAGSISKPKVMDIRPDLRAAKLLFRLKNKGDDALLRAVAEEIESEGMMVAAPHEIVPELLTPAGVLTRRAPTDKELADLEFAWKTAKQIGQMDIGQCVVVRKGVVAAVEALEGTDAAVRRGCELGGEGCTVVKVFKPGQTDRVDLPSVGDRTILIMAEGKATCLGIEAGKSLFFDRDKTLALADQHNITVVGLEEAFFQGIRSTQTLPHE